MNQGGSSSGFTVVETLIVLAVSALLAGSVLAFIGGRQSKTEFTTGINNLQQQVQQVISQTIGGYYAGSGKLACSSTLGVKPQITNVEAGRGTNDSCIFVGKALVFGPTFNNPAGNTNDYRLYTLVGARQDKDGNEVRSPKAANIVPLAQTEVTGNTSFDDSSYIESKPLENGISFDHIEYDGVRSTRSNPQVFAIITNFAAYNKGNLQSQSQSYSLYPFGKGVDKVAWPNSTDKRSLAETMYKESIDNDTPLKQVKLCFNSGSTDQSGLISIGNDTNNAAGGLGVSLQIFAKNGCVNA